MLDWVLLLGIVIIISIGYDFYCTRIKRKGWRPVRYFWICFAGPALVLGIFGLLCLAWGFGFVMEGSDE